LLGRRNGARKQKRAAEPRSIRAISANSFNRLLADAKLRRVRFHDLCHGSASLLLQNGESLTYVKEQMGHSSINVTVDIYGHLVPGGNRQAVDKLDDVAPAETRKTSGGNKSGNNWRWDQI
jgi:integrase